ncbi:hypothetical protein ACF06N_16345 [Streptomyces albidoflavus]
MQDEIRLVSDGEGLAVFGDVGDVERFLVSEGLVGREVGSGRLKAVMGVGVALAQEGVEGGAGASGRWVKLTAESAEQVKKYGLRESAAAGVSTGVLKGDRGQIKGFVEFVRGSRSFVGNPVALANVAKLLAQVAMEQAMDEITEYLDAIDAKVDDVLRAQKDAVLSRMVGTGFVIEEAMTVRRQRGGVDEVTWSKVQGGPAVIAEVQAYALRQLDALAEKMERQAKIGELAGTIREAEPVVREWLAVLARCFQLQDAVAVLELDRVRDVSPEELNGHRLGLREARQDRQELILRCTDRLVTRMNVAAGAANAKVLLHPAKSPAVVEASNQVVVGVHEFQERLGNRSGRRSTETRRWMEAAVEARDRALETGAKGVAAAMTVGNETLDRAGTVRDKLASGIAERARRMRGGKGGGEVESAGEG